MRLQDKVALITGAGSGIGRATSLLFAQEGAKVVVVDINEQGGLETVENINNMDGSRSETERAIYVQANVARANQCQQMVQAAEEAFGQLDILFNNAGISHAEDDDALNTSEAVWDMTFAVNVKGVFLGCKYKQLTWTNPPRNL